MRVPSLENLYLIRWKDEVGQPQKLKILEEIGSKWKDAGILLGQGTKLANYEKKTNDIVELCTLVFTHWIKNNGYKPHYPLSWTGLCDLLDDIEHSTLRIRLLEVLREYS